MSNKSFKIKDIFKDHWDDFIAQGYPIHSAVFKNVDKIIKCGEPSMGHAIYFCENCGKFKHVYFTCKSRFCNSCGAKYIQDRASSISAKLIRCKHRHVVFTIPEEQFKMIRYYGLYAKEYIHSSKLYRIQGLEKRRFIKKQSHWRARILLAFGVDPLCCSCGHTMELVDIFISGRNPYIDNLSSPRYNNSA